MSIFAEIAAFAQDRGAVYLGAKSLANLALATFRTNLSASQGQAIRLAKAPYFVRLDATTGMSTGQPGQRLDAIFADQAGSLFLTGTEYVHFAFSFGIYNAAGVQIVLTTITLEFQDIAFEVALTPTMLSCDPGEARIVPKATRVPDFDALIALEGLDPTDVARVEGMLLYGGLATTVSQTVRSRQQIDMKALFPSVSFDGVLDSRISADAKFLFITGRMSQNPGFACPCNDIGDGIGPVSPGSATGDPGADPGEASAGGITIGGPQPVHVTNRILGIRRRGAADSGIYLPRAYLEPVIAGPFPAVRLDISDNGFIGWKAAGIVDFANANVQVDAARGRVIISFDFRLEVYGSIHVDLGKFGKIRVTSFSAEQDDPGGNKCEICFYLVIGTNGIYLKPVLEVLTFSAFHVFLRVGTLIGTPFGGWGAVIGFIFDEILSKLIEHDIPHELDKAMREYMGQAIFPLLDANYALTLANEVPVPAGRSVAALYDGDATALLASAGLVAGRD